MKKEVKLQIIKETPASEFLDYLDETFIKPFSELGIEINHYSHHNLPEGGVHILCANYDGELDLEGIDLIMKYGEDDNQPLPEFVIYCGTIIVYITYFN